MIMDACRHSGEKKEKNIRRRGKRGRWSRLVEYPGHPGWQRSPFLCYFHKSRSCAVVLYDEYEVRFGRILDGGTSLEGRHNPFFSGLSCRPLVRPLSSISFFLEQQCGGCRIKHHSSKDETREEVLALVGVGLEQGRGYLGSHFGEVRACVSVFESVQGVRRCEGFRLIPVQGNVTRHTTK